MQHRFLLFQSLQFHHRSTGIELSIRVEGDQVMFDFGKENPWLHKARLSLLADITQLAGWNLTWTKTKKHEWILVLGQRKPFMWTSFLTLRRRFKRKKFAYGRTFYPVIGYRNCVKEVNFPLKINNSCHNLAPDWTDKKVSSIKK